MGEEVEVFSSPTVSYETVEAVATGEFLNVTIFLIGAVISIGGAI